MEMLQKRKHQTIDETSLNNLIENEKKKIKSLLAFGVPKECVLSRSFTPCELLGPERDHLGMLMFRLETDAESPKFLLISVLFLAMNAFNVSFCTRTSLANLYKTSLVDSINTMLDSCSYLEEKVSLFGVTNYISQGTNCLISCVMQGHVYDVRKENIYGLVILKDLLLEPDWEPRQNAIQYIYLCYIYRQAFNKIEYGIYIVLSELTHEEVLIDLLRNKFSKERFMFMNYLINGDGNLNYFGSLQRIGHCKTQNIKSGILDLQGISLTIIRLKDVFVELCERKIFL
ncbi:minor capsid protein [Human betaherpesvirus 7]|uniref:Triplex capsid protein 1 n=2 Tax=Human betaherpesvirus 7 TaxID=10372 RepID=TRX1_HHV7J|nr:RecName: Full=Triplex capsid protein 1 [Human herpesvirus 7 strain JI]AAC54691.1 minor capsid protein [Human betaherpesvirus 7]AGV28653.1 U29 [Human betaherpesvirus 7]UQK62767.1 U29 [Human betaherpesvirus 7]UQK62984.1 U29 [Human betaherpesvirus 7]